MSNSATERRMVVARSWAWVGVWVESWEFMSNGCRVSLWEVEKGSGDRGW